MSNVLGYHRWPGIRRVAPAIGRGWLRVAVGLLQMPAQADGYTVAIADPDAGEVEAAYVCGLVKGLLLFLTTVFCAVGVIAGLATDPGLLVDAVMIVAFAVAGSGALDAVNGVSVTVPAADDTTEVTQQHE